MTCMNKYNNVCIPKMYVRAFMYVCAYMCKYSYLHPYVCIIATVKSSRTAKTANIRIYNYIAIHT